MNRKGDRQVASLQALRDRLHQFRGDRDWEQYHDPKNLAEAISIEAGELLELFLWKRCDESCELDDSERNHLEQEMGDIVIYLVYLADAFGFDIIEAAMKKVDLNERKYPVDKARGSSKKYSEL